MFSGGIKWEHWLEMELNDSVIPKVNRLKYFTGESPCLSMKTILLWVRIPLTYLYGKIYVVLFLDLHF